MNFEFENNRGIYRASIKRQDGRYITAFYWPAHSHLLRINTQDTIHTDKSLLLIRPNRYRVTHGMLRGLAHVVAACGLKRAAEALRDTATRVVLRSLEKNAHA